MNVLVTKVRKTGEGEGLFGIWKKGENGKFSE